MGLPMNLSSANVAFVATITTLGLCAFTILLFADDLSVDQHTVTPSCYVRWKHYLYVTIRPGLHMTLSACMDYQINQITTVRRHT